MGGILRLSTSKNSLALVKAYAVLMVLISVISWFMDQKKIGRDVLLSLHSNMQVLQVSRLQLNGQVNGRLTLVVLR